MGKLYIFIQSLFEINPDFNAKENLANSTKIITWYLVLMYEESGEDLTHLFLRCKFIFNLFFFFLAWYPPRDFRQLVEQCMGTLLQRGKFFEEMLVEGLCC